MGKDFIRVDTLSHNVSFATPAPRRVRGRYSDDKN